MHDPSRIWYIIFQGYLAFFDQIKPHKRHFLMLFWTAVLKNQNKMGHKYLICFTQDGLVYLLSFCRALCSYIIGWGHFSRFQTDQRTDLNQSSVLLTPHAAFPIDSDEIVQVFLDVQHYNYNYMYFKIKNGPNHLVYQTSSKSSTRHPIEILLDVYQSYFSATRRLVDIYSF